jgi:hypothetical protein
VTFVDARTTASSTHTHCAAQRLQPYRGILRYVVF